MSFTIQTTWKKEMQTGVPGEWNENVLPEYRDLVKAFLKNYIKRQAKQDDDLIIQHTISLYTSIRNLDQNALMHAMYKIYAECINSCMSGGEKYTVTGWEVYENDLREYCPKEELIVRAENLDMYKRQFRHTHVLEREGNEYVRIQIWKTTSHFNKREMAYWIDMIVNRLAEIGVPDHIQALAKEKWIEYKKWLNSFKIILHCESSISKEEYKAKVPICEASGSWLGQQGEVAHIVAIGMGGHEEPEKDHPRNWLHLSHECHIALQHQKGWNAFIKIYPWLSYKIKLAQGLASQRRK